MSFIPIDLSEKSKILVIGAGGGFDFVCGLPIVLELINQGHDVFIGNYSFTELNKIKNAQWLNENLLAVDENSYHQDNAYFPEGHLAAWMSKQSIDTKIFCLAKKGVKPTLASYDQLIEIFNIDTVFCVDGGVDGIFRGDEFDLGTPSMDSISVIAASLCKAAEKVYVSTAFGIEGAESRVPHAHVLHRMADLMLSDAVFGVSILRKSSPVGMAFSQAVHFIHSRMQVYQSSTIASAILASIEGKFGYTAVNAKTQERKLWISPLNALYWYFDAEAVAKMKLFYTDVLTSESVVEVGQAIEKLRQNISIKPYEQIPY